MQLNNMLILLHVLAFNTMLRMHDEYLVKSGLAEMWAVEARDARQRPAQRQTSTE
jgi:hypothetical protein